MANIVYVGDEVTAAGYRLAGVETLVPEADAVAASLERAIADGAEMILLSGTLAAGLDADALETALAREAPLLAIVPDVFGHGAPPDIAHAVRGALGIEP